MKIVLIFFLFLFASLNAFSQTVFESNQVHTRYPDDPPTTIRFSLVPSRITIQKKSIEIDADGEIIKLKAKKKLVYENLDWMEYFFGLTDEFPDYSVYDVKKNNHQIKQVQLAPDENGELFEVVLRYKSGVEIGYAHLEKK